MNLASCEAMPGDESSKPSHAMASAENQFTSQHSSKASARLADLEGINNPTYIPMLSNEVIGRIRRNGASAEKHVPT